MTRGRRGSRAHLSQQQSFVNNLLKQGAILRWIDNINAASNHPNRARCHGTAMGSGINTACHARHNHIACLAKFARQSFSMANGIDLSIARPNKRNHRFVQQMQITSRR